MKKSMTGTVSSGSTTIGLTALAVLQRLTTKGSLVDLAVLRPRKRYSEVLELSKCETTDEHLNSLVRTSMTVLGASRHM
jgi:hypothetical protein